MPISAQMVRSDLLDVAICSQRRRPISGVKRVGRPREEDDGEGQQSEIGGRTASSSGSDGRLQARGDRGAGEAFVFMGILCQISG